MYVYIKGTLVEASPCNVIIDVQGVGYQLHIPVSDFNKLPQVGEDIFLHTCFIVREMSQTLYGFLEKQMRDLFEELIAVNRIGPKIGLGIIGHLCFEQLQAAVEANDSTIFARVPGIGKKMAQRLIVELQGRLNKPILSYVPQLKGSLRDALKALMQLGYTQTAAEKALKHAAATLSGECDLATLITKALKER